MPGWLLRIWPNLLAAAAVLAGVAYIDHRGYERAQRDQAALEQRLGAKVAEGLSKIDTDLSGRLGAIDSTRTIIQPTLTREITHEARYSDPACSLTDGVWQSLGAARAASAAGADSGSVPTGRFPH